LGQFLDVAEHVIREQRRPLKPREIVDLGKDGGLFSDKLAGKTPHQTLKAKISVDIRRKGSSSRFVRTAPNTFYLRELLINPSEEYKALPQTRPGASERVVVFPDTVLDKIGRFQGINRGWRRLIDNVLNDRECKALPRLVAEQTDGLKQLLTYILVTRNDQLLSFRRGTFNRLEDYLRGSLCVGFGGHVSETDRTLFNKDNYRQVIFDNAARELFEELRLPEPDRRRLSSGEGLTILGILNDDSSPTGRKHLAVVLAYEASQANDWNRPLRGEKSITQLSWLRLSRFNRELRDFEYWSQLCLVEFFPDAVQTQPSFVIRRMAPFKRTHTLCIIGEIGSGKSVTTDVLKREFAYTEINSGVVMADLLGIPAVPQTDREEFQRRAWAFISRRGGPAKLARALLRRVNQSRAPVLIDGIRQRATLHELRKQAGSKQIAVLFVYTPPHIAYRFFSQRSARGLDIREFLALRDAPVEAEVRKLIAGADAVLYNWTGKLKYERVVRNLMRALNQ